MPARQKEKLVLVQSKVKKSVRDKIDALAKATKRKRSGYIAVILEAHSERMTPKLAKALHSAWDGVKETA